MLNVGTECELHGLDRIHRHILYDKDNKTSVQNSICNLCYIYIYTFFSLWLLLCKWDFYRIHVWFYIFHLNCMQKPELEIFLLFFPGLQFSMRLVFMYVVKKFTCYHIFMLCHQIELSKQVTVCLTPIYICLSKVNATFHLLFCL